MKWMGPVIHIELKTGGYIRTNYDPKKPMSDSSSIQLGIINYLEPELLTLKVKLNSNFFQKAQNSDQHLQQLIQFIQEGPSRTRIISNMLGWGQGPEWDETYNFFVQGNTWHSSNCLKCFRKNDGKGTG